ncbi:hypothetical protein BH11ARM2_BH11ARM2_08080 [soil metagenome]
MADPGFVAYPRGEGTYGNAARLRALADGYFGYGLVFGINFLLAVVASGLIQARITNYLMVIPVMFFAIGGLSYGPNRRIGEGKGWGSSGAVLASVLVGLNSALCCGIIGVLVMQNIARREIERYGVPKGGFFGLKKPAVEATIAQREALEGGRAV